MSPSRVGPKAHIFKTLVDPRLLERPRDHLFTISIFCGNREKCQIWGMDMDELMGLSDSSKIS